MEGEGLFGVVVVELGKPCFVSLQDGMPLLLPFCSLTLQNKERD